MAQLLLLKVHWRRDEMTLIKSKSVGLNTNVVLYTASVAGV